MKQAQPILGQSLCPGCGLEMIRNPREAYEGYYHTTPECWGIYSELLGMEYSNPVLYGRTHQLTLDTYAAQHAGGSHPDKSIMIHLASLYRMIVEEMSPAGMPQFRKHLTDTVSLWPHLAPPGMIEGISAFDVLLANSPEEQIERVEEWARLVWNAWSDHHEGIAAFVDSHRSRGY